MSNDDKQPVTGLQILVADEDTEALERTARILGGLGHHVTASAIDLAEATEAVAREDPELSVVVLHRDDEHALALIDEITAFARGPVIALASDDNRSFAARAAERGIYAYTRELDAEALQGAIDVAMRRHNEVLRLHQQVGELESALERRALIERAKGILMERHGIGEREAFEALRTYARSRSRSVVQVSAAVLEGRELLPATSNGGTGGANDAASKWEQPLVWGRPVDG